jgi:hypothetical protein
MGSSEYTIIITIEGVEPIPKKGTKNPSKAKLGIACTALANPITNEEVEGNFAIKIPNGTPIAIAIIRAITDN